MNILRSIAFSSFSAACALVASGASAAEHLKFDAAAFDAATKAGKPVLVDIAASWCPTCKAQHPIIEELTAAPEYKDLIVFDVDFDTQGDVLKRFKVRVQSTLIAFKGATETGRSVGDTRKESISTLLKSAI